MAISELKRLRWPVIQLEIMPLSSLIFPRSVPSTPACQTELNNRKDQLAICSYRRDTASEFENELNICERNADIQSESELKLKVCIRRSLIDDCKPNYAGEYRERPPAFN